MPISEDAGSLDGKQDQPLGHAGAERVELPSALPWLFPWLLAIAGILITLALTR